MEDLETIIMELLVNASFLGIGTIPGCRLQWLWNKDKNHMR